MCENTDPKLEQLGNEIEYQKRVFGNNLYRVYIFGHNDYVPTDTTVFAPDEESAYRQFQWRHPNFNKRSFYVK